MLSLFFIFRLRTLPSIIYFLPGMYVVIPRSQVAYLADLVRTIARVCVCVCVLCAQPPRLFWVQVYTFRYTCCVAHHQPGLVIHRKEDPSVRSTPTEQDLLSFPPSSVLPCVLACLLAVVMSISTASRVRARHDPSSTFESKFVSSITIAFSDSFIIYTPVVQHRYKSPTVKCNPYVTD